MNDAELLLLVESRRKSGGVAALLNLFLPGFGYIYCGRWILGALAFLFVVSWFILDFNFSAVGVVLILVVDGFLCAGRYNKKLIEKVLKERAESKEKTSTRHSAPAS